jgi:hypothetical protein
VTMRALAASVLWLAAGQIAIAALYWTFLNTPESNAWMLAASMLLVLLMLATAGVVTARALDAWRSPAAAGPLRDLARLPAFLIALGAGVAVWWAAARADAWLTAHAGEISAWFIATFNWADASPFFRGAGMVMIWWQWVAAPVAALAVLAVLTSGGDAASLPARRLRHAFAPRTMALATVWIVLLVLLPLQLLGWRMSGLPPTWVEPAVVGARLLLVGLAATVGWALVCGTIVTMGPAAFVPSGDNRDGRSGRRGTERGA